MLHTIPREKWSVERSPEEIFSSPLEIRMAVTADDNGIFAPAGEVRHFADSANVRFVLQAITSPRAR